jgi:hypothetical protein
MTPEVRWEDVQEWFDLEENGSLPDVQVPNTTIADWQALIDLIRAKGWGVEYSEDGRIVRLPDRVEDMLDRPNQTGVELKVWPIPEILVIFRPYGVEQIDGDVDLQELQGQGRLDILCAFLRDIGSTLGKPVLLTPEGAPDQPVMGYRVEDNQVVVLAAPWGA